MCQSVMHQMVMALWIYTLKQSMNAIHEFWSVIWGTLVLLHKYQISQQKVKIMTFDLWKTGSCVKYDK